MVILNGGAGLKGPSGLLLLLFPCFPFKLDNAGSGVTSTSSPDGVSLASVRCVRAHNISNLKGTVSTRNIQFIAQGVKHP